MKYLPPIKSILEEMDIEALNNAMLHLIDETTSLKGDGRVNINELAIYFGSIFFKCTLIFICI